MLIRFLTIAVLLGIYAQSGCRDDREIRQLTKLANEPVSNESTSVSEPASDGLSRPSDKTTEAMPHGGGKLSFADKSGCIEWVHRPDESAARLYFFNADMQPLGSIGEPVLWLNDLTGPEPIALSACQPVEPGCWLAESPLLARTAPQGLIRFELGREPYRIRLPIRKTEREYPAMQPAAMHDAQLSTPALTSAEKPQ